ncbi:GGDEF domain-containing protein [Allohahella marinimesophila]|uniref:GGDEF domain-containing protein n=1 Tax=Allohahella marinimesophila TaxID=1054972 RepID=A0ABP7NH55_9GAMM
MPNRTAEAVIPQHRRRFVYATVVPAEAGAVNMTVSIGIAAGVPSKRDGQAELLTLADARLYMAKSNGRNRFETGAC